MINIDSSTKEMLLENSTFREIILRFPDDDIPDIGSGNIVSESFELVDSICDAAEFRLGGGIASQMSIELINITASLQGKKLAVYIRQQYIKNELYPQTNLFPGGSIYPGSGEEYMLYPGINLFSGESLYPGRRENEVEYKLFTGKVLSFKRKKNNRAVFQLLAYNALYDNSKISVSATTLEMIHHQSGGSTGSETLSQFIRGIVESRADEDFIISADSTARVNSDNTMEKLSNELITKVADKGLTLTEILTAYAELNASFLVCNRDGNFHLKSLCEYISLNNTQKIGVSEVIDYYSNLEFEEYTVAPITSLRFKYNDNKSQNYGSSNNGSRYQSDNIILRMMSVASKFITGFWKPNGTNYIFYHLYTYRPYKADVFARWWLEPGDRIQIKTGYDDTPIVDSFVFSRTIKGINGMQVTIEAKGTQYIGKKEETE